MLMPFLNLQEEEQLTDIRWIEAAGEYVCIHTSNGSRILRKALEEMEKALDPAIFVRVHESAIVSKSHIRGLRALSGGDGILQLEGGAEVRARIQYFSGLDPGDR